SAERRVENCSRSQDQAMRLAGVRKPRSRSFPRGSNPTVQPLGSGKYGEVGCREIGMVGDRGEEVLRVLARAVVVIEQLTGGSIVDDVVVTIMRLADRKVAGRKQPFARDCRKCRLLECQRVDSMDKVRDCGDANTARKRAHRTKCEEVRAGAAGQYVKSALS